MKSLLVYLHPSKQFDTETDTLMRIQIDNHFSLGWKKEDILIVNSFPYEYNGVKSIVMEDTSFCEYFPESAKTIAITHLFKEGLIEEEEIYWAHDPDAFQLNPITVEELELDKVAAGFTDYGRQRNWAMGSFFFKEEAKGIFDTVKKEIYKHKKFSYQDEHALWALTNNPNSDIGSKVKCLNITYNFGMRKMVECYEKAIKPLRVLHFHPFASSKRGMFLNNLPKVMYGKNRLNMPLMNQRMIDVFNFHGLK